LQIVGRNIILWHQTTTVLQQDQQRLPQTQQR
jgi:hypothetical protein